MDSPINAYAGVKSYTPATYSSVRNAEEHRIRTVLIDGDVKYRCELSDELEYLGFDVISYPTGKDALGYFAKYGDTEVIVLGWELGDGLGIELVPRLTEAGVSVPIVFVTAMPAATYECAALDAGAMDFVDKARGAAILSRRLRLTVQGSKAAESRSLGRCQKCGPLVLRTDVSRAYWNDVDVGLTVIEFDLVHLFVSKAGTFLTYRAIYDRIRIPGFVAGSGEDGFRTNVRSSIKRIRNKFRAIDADFAEIENYARFGYRWRA